MRNIFSAFKKTFGFETFTYMADKSMEDVVQSLHLLFTDKNRMSRSPDLKGKFVDFPESFSITPKTSFGSRTGESFPAILKGLISKQDVDTTKIEITIRANRIFVVFFVLSLAWLPVNIYKAITDFHWSYLLIIGLIVTCMLPAAFYGAQGMKEQLKRNFEKYMNIRQAFVK
ncbi:MAG: hypothetical protein WCF67_23735 [Chitinophagaceae bacterium]